MERIEAEIECDFCDKIKEKVFVSRATNRVVCDSCVEAISDMMDDSDGE